jgi:hypothetical protein
MNRNANVEVSPKLFGCVDRRFERDRERKAEHSVGFSPKQFIIYDKLPM